MLLHVRALTKAYRNTRNGLETWALNGLELDVYRQEFISIMGPSGSGKTTLLNILAGLDRPTSGELCLQGENMLALNADELALFRRRNLGFVFQDFNLLDTLTLAENVALPLSLDKRGGGDIRQRVDEMLHFLSLGEQMQRYPYEVSGGQQQRTAVARALIHRPRLLLADEPTGNLDSASARALLELFQQLNSQQQATILMVTHDPFSASYSQRVVFIKDGRVFCQLQRSSSQPQFFQSILDALAHVEGGHELA
ncbi:ABC transporter ATP-binding protein [Ktedonosporobacter rubrisoli]|uniref:ABC transporter ATP-binding protein n=2 Tax=Ktedonosporobacter rubrisoli TaxID=2509675 RepID=A0A4P6K5U2_KTERU|nr:ABC transporter ATP-binding protein [Ktedonosporobacter rubrisoli]